MEYIELHFAPELIEEMFPCGDEGENVRSTPMAEAHAKVALDLLDVPSNTELGWHLPDVFSVRYGSSYVASATYGNKTVRFHSTDGTFREGDDKL